VDLAFGPAKLQDLDPVTVGCLFKKTVAQVPDGVALKFKVDNHWTEVSYTEYYNMVVKAAKSFIKVNFAFLVSGALSCLRVSFLQLGVQEYHGVCILGFNSPEWLISNLGAMFAGYDVYLA
jgi:long-chain-fatty-acid--CoA ligase ACSBG